MSTPADKRAAKVRKRQQAKEVDMARIDKREAKLRVAFDAAGGVDGSTMLALVRYFESYRVKGRPDLMLDALDWIRALNLMALPEHRYGIAGAIRGAVDLVPLLTDSEMVPGSDDRTPGIVASWKAAYPKIMESVDRLMPSADDAGISRTGHVDYLGMRWLVTRDKRLIERIIRIGHRQDDIGQQANIFLDTYRHIPDVHNALVAPARQAPPAAGPNAERAQDVDELIRYLLAVPDNQEHVVFVGWFGNQPGMLSARFLIVTINGDRPKHCPDTWKEQPVAVRVATQKELIAHRQLVLAKEQP